MKKPKSTRKKRPYKVEMIFNGNKVKKQTDNVDSVIVSEKPDILYTEMYVTVTKNKHIVERKLNLIQGKKLFSDVFFRTVFINNLLLN